MISLWCDKRDTQFSTLTVVYSIRVYSTRKIMKSTSKQKAKNLQRKTPFSIHTSFLIHTFLTITAECLKTYCYSIWLTLSSEEKINQ